MSATRENDEPAFPRDERYLGHNGMSLRDWFAGQALAGLCANPGGPYQANDLSGWGLVNCGTDDIGGEAYRIADAMLAERSKP